MFIVHHVSQFLLCSSHRWFVESFMEMDAFKLLDSWTYELAIERPTNLAVNELEISILLEEVLQVQGVVNEE